MLTITCFLPAQVYSINYSAVFLICTGVNYMEVKSETDRNVSSAHSYDDMHVDAGETSCNSALTRVSHDRHTTAGVFCYLCVFAVCNVGAPYSGG